MAGESDISWQLLGQIVQQWAGDPAELTEVIPLGGGSVNSTYQLVTGDHRKAVLKISPHMVNRQLASEAYQLQQLHNLGLPVPQIYVSHIATLDQPNTYLLMEYVDGMSMNKARKVVPPEQWDRLQHQLSELVARLHARIGSNYGKVDCDDSPPTDQSWAIFFRALYDSCWQQVQKVNAIPIKVRRKIDKLHTRLEHYLHHHDQPRLLHGDFWCGNILCKQDENQDWNIACIIDPNCRYGHAESEIAYLDLFESITPTFKKQYQTHFKLDEDYHKVRKPIYQLYPMISNVAFFGDRYVPPLMKIVERAIALV